MRTFTFRSTFLYDVMYLSFLLHMESINISVLQIRHLKVMAPDFQLLNKFNILLEKLSHSSFQSNQKKVEFFKFFLNLKKSRVGHHAGVR